MAPPPSSNGSLETSMAWIGLAGAGILAMGFLLGSLAAPRNRRMAGALFLAVMPVAAFCLAYSTSGVVVWRDGTGWFEAPRPLTALGLAALFYAPFLAVSRMWGHKRRAAVAFGLTALAAGLAFANSRWTGTLITHLAAASALFLMPGSFWLWTDQHEWPALRRPRPRSREKWVLSLASQCAGILCLGVVATLALSALNSSLAGGECRGKPPFTGPLSATHAVFTTKILFAGRSFDAVARDPDGLRVDSSEAAHSGEVGTGPSALSRTDSGGCLAGCAW